MLCYMGRKKLVTKAEFSRLSGRTASAVTQVTRTCLKDAYDGERIDAAHPAAVKYIAGKDVDTTVGVDSLYEDAVKMCNETGRFTVSNISRSLKIGVARAKRIYAMMEATNTDKPKKLPARVVSGSESKRITKKTTALTTLNDDINHGTTLHEIPDDILKFADMTLREIIQRFGTDTAFLDYLNAVKRIEDINEKRLKNAATRGDLINRKLIKVGVIDHFDQAFNQLLSDGAKTIARRVTAMYGAGRSVEDCEHLVADQISSFIRPAKAKISRTLRNV